LQLYWSEHSANYASDRRIKVHRIVALLIAAVFLFPVTSFSQRRKRTTTKSTQASSAPKGAEVQRDGARRVADQIKVLTRFIYLLGGVAKGLEAFDDDAARGNQTSSAVIEQVKRNKLSVRTSIQGVRDGLDALELHFRTTPELQRYYIKLAGSAAGASNADDQAAANQFDKAGRTLLEVVNRLTDVLLEMR
jgi:hypothetical protein